MLMFLAACLQTMFEQQSMFQFKVLQMRLRTALTGLVYRKVRPLAAWAGWVWVQGAHSQAGG